MCEPETFLTLLKDPNHWLFELLLIFIFDGVIGLILWPLLKSKALHHESDDQKILRLEKQVKEMRMFAEARGFVANGRHWK
jgi:hypothetical protein